MDNKDLHGEHNGAFVPDADLNMNEFRNGVATLTKDLHGELNGGFVQDGELNTSDLTNGKRSTISKVGDLEKESPEEAATGPARDQWGGGLEFLMSCIAMSIGLGNIWRFPYTAYSNGGGAFLIPYIIVLFLVGKPVYFLEMYMGQFSSKGSVKVYDFCPGMRGTGAGQTLAVTSVMTYYASLMAIIIYYMFGSFSSELPWAVCDAAWSDCYPSGDSGSVANLTGLKSSSELYFKRVVLREVPDINDGIGVPEWKLLLCLLMAWLSVYLVLLRGVKSSGKAAYFLALFPYVIMLVLLVKACTLPGAKEGIIFFINPDFSKIWDPQVWYAAVTQCFFSLSVCFGNVVMYSSYNNFRHNVYRDAMIVTSLDTVTSLIAGFTIFGILGNLALETGLPVEDVVQGGTELAFISYPDAISKFDNVPQVFSFLFFFMLYVLGVGSNVAMASSIITVFRDKYPNLKGWMAATMVAVFGFSVGVVYITPGGQYILNLVDHHGASFVVFLVGIGELTAILWIYGVRKVCDDIEFMLGISVGFYWRLCWAIITPALLIVVFIYSLITLEQIMYNGVEYPASAIASGWILSAIGIMQIPIFAFIAVYKRKHIIGLKNRVVAAFSPRADWGPVDPKVKKEWLAFVEQKKLDRSIRPPTSGFMKIFNSVFGY